MAQPYSVLMAVYKKDDPSFLATAIESMLKQTILCEQFILVEDGPLPDILEDVIVKYEKNSPELFTVVRLSENKGLANALNNGIAVSRNERVARMDSDDISLPERFAKQLAFLEEHKDVAIIGAWHQEFPKTKTCKAPREVKLLDLFKNNLISHPTIMLRQDEFKNLQEISSYFDKK